jgi:hypothetical protein
MNITKKDYVKFVKEIDEMNIGVYKNGKSFILRMIKYFKDEQSAKVFRHKIYDQGVINYNGRGYCMVVINGKHAKNLLENGLLNELKRDDDWKIEIATFLLAMDEKDRQMKAQVYQNLQKFTKNGRGKLLTFNVINDEDL